MNNEYNFERLFFNYHLNKSMSYYYNNYNY